MYSTKISEILSTVSNDQFHRKIEQLKLIINCWANNKELSINLLENETCVLDDYIIEEEVDVEEEDTADHDVISDIPQMANYKEDTDDDAIIIPSANDLFANFPNANEPVGKYCKYYYSKLINLH